MNELLRKSGTISTNVVQDVVNPLVFGSEFTPGATDAGRTNNQEFNIDEADLLKNDNKYLYAISKQRLYII